VRAPRGQSLIEASLAMIVMVGIIVLGIHTAEVMTLSIRAPKVGHAALFDATGHDIRGPGLAATTAQLDGKFMAEAADLDLRTSTNGASTLIGAFTQVTAVSGIATSAKVRIDRPTTCSYPPDDPFANYPAALDTGFSMEVMPTVQVTTLRVASNFLNDGHGFFKEGLEHRNTYNLCALGRNLGGTCTGQYRVLLDDWALHYEDLNDPWDRTDWGLMGGANQRYFDRAQGHFTPGNAAASTLATTVLGSSPDKEDAFWMSFRDANAGFMENGFKTGPGPASRTSCYLGSQCP
jgi:hypothetical protein